MVNFALKRVDFTRKLPLWAAVILCITYFQPTGVYNILTKM